MIDAPKGELDHMYVLLEQAFSIKISDKMAKRLQMFQLARSTTKDIQLGAFIDLAKNKYYIEKFDEKESEIFNNLSTRISRPL